MNIKKRINAVISLTAAHSCGTISQHIFDVMLKALEEQLTGLVPAEELESAFFEGYDARDNLTGGLPYQPYRQMSWEKSRAFKLVNESKPSVKEPENDPMTQCDACGEQCRESKLIVRAFHIKDLFQRVDPGGPMPSGQCNNCGCLAYRVGIDDPVVVEVSGGVAEVTSNPRNVEVKIIDHDNEQHQ